MDTEAPRRFQRALSVAVAFLRLAVVAQGFDLGREVAWTAGVICSRIGSSSIIGAEGDDGASVTIGGELAGEA